MQHKNTIIGKRSIGAVTRFGNEVIVSSSLIHFTRAYATSTPGSRLDADIMDCTGRAYKIMAVLSFCIAYVSVRV